MSEKKISKKLTLDVLFSLLPKDFKSFKISYSYYPVKGQLNVWPLKLDF